MNPQDLKRRLAYLETQLQAVRVRLEAPAPHSFDPEFTRRLTQTRLDTIDQIKNEIVQIRARLK
jgi:hypothetical protein